MDAETELLNPRAVPGDNRPPVDFEAAAPPTAPVQENDTVEGEVEEALASLNERLATLKAEAAKIAVICNDEQRGRVIECGKSSRALFNDVDATFSRIKAPYLKASQIVDVAFRGPKAEAKAVLDGLTDRVSAYDREKAAKIRREAEEVARKAREEEQQRLDAQRAAEVAGRAAHAAQHQAKADAAADAAERAEALARKSVQELTRARTSTGSTVSSSTKWRGEIVDAAKLDVAALWPLIPLEAKQKALDAWVKNNTSKATTAAPVLAGARIFPDVRTRI